MALIHRQHAKEIWQAGVDAVRSDTLVRRCISIHGDSLSICGRRFDTSRVGRIEIVGAGKAGAGMAAGAVEALGTLSESVSLSGWVNVPEDCVRQIPYVHLHAARPAGLNEPTPEGVAGTKEILQRVSSLSADDICLVLISGGGSALLPCPSAPFSLNDKLLVTQFLAAAGAPIQELNQVRSQMSEVKNGGLLRHCRAGVVITLIISDIVDDPVHLIASGPTVIGPSDVRSVIQIAERYDPARTELPSVFYETMAARITACIDRQRPDRPMPESIVKVIGSNADALAAALRQAEKLGYTPVSLGSNSVGEARRHGQLLRERLRSAMISEIADVNTSGICFVAGGETTVRLTGSGERGRGGRNQEVVLGAIATCQDLDQWSDIVLLSGGTDGEDGPTDAAGAIADSAVIRAMIDQDLSPESYLSRNDAYSFFAATNGLLMTGPTHTNVMDVAVGIRFFRSVG